MLRRTAAALAAVLTALLAAPAPAVAADPVPWTMAPCATAYLGSAARDHSVHWFVIPGTAYQCAPTVTGGGIRLAVYPAGSQTGHSAGYQVRLFRTLETSPEFGVAIVPTLPGVNGVCVLAGEHTRITCVRVTVAADNRTATTERIDADDPLVAKEVRTAPYEGNVYPPAGKGGNPTCGTCY
jgi:hypothetical protein